MGPNWNAYTHTQTILCDVSWFVSYLPNAIECVAVAPYSDGDIVYWLNVYVANLNVAIYLIVLSSLPAHLVFLSRGFEAFGPVTHSTHMV